MYELATILPIAFGVLLMGFSKAGFGGGLGVLTTPLCVIALAKAGKPPAFAIGFMLPLLIIADSTSVWHYWRKWELTNLKFLLPGVVLGVVAGVQIIDLFSARQFNIAIGLLSMGFVAFQLLKERIFAAERSFEPNHTVGIPCGILAGVTSTFANGAGPVISMFLIPQRLPKVTYVATNALIFAWINWIKLAVFLPKGLLTRKTLAYGVWFVPIIPLGVWLGVWLNKRVPERWFTRLVYAFTFLTGLHLALS